MVLNEPKLAHQRAASLAALAARLERSVDEGDLPRATDVPALARYLQSVMCGMSTAARDGGARATELHTTAELALRALPGAPSKPAQRPRASRRPLARRR